MHQNGIMEDIGAAIGFEATNRLIAVYGGTTIYVPEQLNEDHPITRVVGLVPARHLINEFGGTTLNLPANNEFHRLRRIRQVAGLIKAGQRTSEVAVLVGATTRQVQRNRLEAEQLGLLPEVPRESLG